MTITPSDPRRASRLEKKFKDVTIGNRQITTAIDARLFLEAVWTKPTPAACLELVTNSSAGLDALRHSLRIDLSVSFMKSHVLPFIAYLNDPGVKMRYNGQLLHNILLLIIDPPVLWNNLVSVYKAAQLNEEELYVFAWMCLELSGLPGNDHDSIISDISSVLQQPPFQETQDHRTRDLMYRIKNTLDLRCTNSTEKTLEAAGGRHDNDFANFRKIAIFPTSDEFYSSTSPFYRQACEVAAVESAIRPKIHLDNQFRLLREDMLGELRDDLKIATGRKRYKKSPQILAGLTSAGINTGNEERGRFCALYVSCLYGLEFMKQLNTQQRSKFLDDNKRFLCHNSFGALCGENHIVAFAFLVRDVDQLVKWPPIVGLQFTSSDALARALQALKPRNNLRFILVDTPVFAYQPVLERLQEISEMPLAGGLLRLDTDEEEFSTPSLNLSTSMQNHVRNLEGLLAGDCQKVMMNGFNLDQSQARAVRHALQSSVALIQGPPGTGKSFVGALAAKILLEDPQKRILVLSYTNHALDQFLEDLMRIGIPSDIMVRLGSKSTEATKMLSLEKPVRKTYFKWPRGTKEKMDRLKSDSFGLRDQIEYACNDLLQRKVRWSDLLEFLEFPEDTHDFYEAFALPEQNDGFQFAGQAGKKMSPEYLLERWAHGKGVGNFRQLRSAVSQGIWRLPIAQRRQHIEDWTKRLRDEQIETVQNLARQFDEGQSQLDTLYGESKCAYIQTKRVIGCTTTAAAKYKSLIKAAKPDVVLVEEAGEILEAHVLTALHSATSQLILIGDHKQLRPKINNYALSVEKGDGFDLNRSLFERLILQGHEHVTLQKQHRMHPEISHLVREMTYPNLLDDEKTLSRGEPKGLQGRVSFINHSHQEDLVKEIADRRDAGLTPSKSNQFEAQMILKLVKYLAQQGYKTDNIVVLTPYLGQLRLLRDLLSKENDPILNDIDSGELIRAGLMTAAAGKVNPGSGRIKLSTIDNYQGEESDVVIASMTRSNKKGDIGFMKAPERLNVMCSRARECLIMIGNMETFMRSPQGRQVWEPFFKLLKEKDYLHDGVAVICQKHPEKNAILKNPGDFDVRCPDGGCDKACNALLACGKHHCQRRCHRIDNHSKVTCHERIKKTCERGHQYNVPCSDQNAACKLCRKEDEDNRRRIQRDLQMEKERMLAQQRYAQELQSIEDETDHFKRRLKYIQEEENEKMKLEQAHANLRSTQETYNRAETMKATLEASKKAAAASAESDQPRASSPFAPGSAQEEWANLKKLSGASSNALDTLMNMIGLESVKEEFLSIKSKVDTAVRQGIKLSDERFGCTLLGNPGTGKTTVARIYSEFLTSVGVIAGSSFKETSGSKLASDGVKGCRALLDDVLNDGGGVIFIDEAYQLSSGNSPGGLAVLEFLLAEVENLAGKIVFVLAGYNKQMESFFAHNPGFPSRFPIEMKFADYDDDELLRILQRLIEIKYNRQMRWQDDLYLRIATRRLGRGRGKEGFGNARAVENLLAIISKRQANRIRKERQSSKNSDDFLFTKEDLIGPEPSSALKQCKAWCKLQTLIGLSSVKESVKALVDSIQTNYRRELAEEPVIDYSLNKVFLGSPGTGKTTVAKLYGQILVDLGLLSNGEVVVKNPADFVGAVLGGSEAQTKGILASTVGKVLVIDEAYGLYGGGGSSGGSSSNSFKTAVVDTIVAEVQSVPGEDRCVLLLGYKDQMEEMFQNVNPGLSRRFPLSSAFGFEDFSSSELRAILDLKLKEQGFSATGRAKQVAMEMLDRARNRPNFGNAGEVDILLNEAKARHQQRLSSKETNQVSTLEALDFDENFDRAERTDTNVAKLFAGTVGCESIVAELEGLQANVRAMKELGMDPKEDTPFNFLFRGPPGTGKTSTARKMGKVFYDMGFLSNADVIECSATDLIGQYVGQTGPKVQQLLDKALGRVLFVDEAYRLAEGGFAKEAVDELVDCVTKDKYKGRMVIILAGYDNDINRLLSINPGMSSRFPKVISFHSLSPENCYDLLLRLFLKKKSRAEENRKGASIDVDCLQCPTSVFRESVVLSLSELCQIPSWASARDVETLAKTIFDKALKSRQGTTVTITETIVLAELQSMIGERKSRAQQAERQQSVSIQPFRQMQPPVQAPENIQMQQDIGTAVTDNDDDEGEEHYTPPESPTEESNSDAQLTIRDPGVSDEDWEQLERDKKAQEERDAKHNALLISQKEASGAAFNAILKELLEEEERRKKEEEERKKAALIGRCPAGYSWIKQANGFRCAGGSHCVSNEQIARF